MKILITGGAGFIGATLAGALARRGDTVVVVDNFNDYYSPRLKRDRLAALMDGHEYTLYRADIRDDKKMLRIFAKERPDSVMHLAAMAGVRNSILDPLLYEETNVRGTLNLLEAARRVGVKNFVYASSSSVYGANTKQPFSETDMTDTPVCPYAATKKATELLAYTYSSLYNLPTTGLRFFTVYGPWGRPDMGVFTFVANIVDGKTIDVYNHGNMRRNFTYIDDIVAGTIVCIDAALPGANIMNIGGDRDEALMDYIAAVEKHAGKKARINLMPMQQGDVQSTVADIRALRKLGWAPTTRIDEGVKNFVAWYRSYYHPKKQHSNGARKTAARARTTKCS